MRLGQGRKTGRPPEEGGSGRLSRAIARCISDGDLPGGLTLDPDRLAPLFGTSRELAGMALMQLESQGITVRSGPVWQVRTDCTISSPQLLDRVGPMLTSMAALAVTRISAAQAAQLLAAYDRIAGFGTVRSARARAEGYELYMRLLAAASGSLFHVEAVERMLAKAAGPIEAFFAADPGNPGSHRVPGPQDELAWLARALMARDAGAARAAAEKHLRLVAVYLAAAAGR